MLVECCLTLFRWALSGLLMDGGQKKAPSLNLSHISYNDEIWHSYNLPKEVPKNIWIMWHTPWVLLTSAFFLWKSANFAISRKRNNFFNFCWVLKDFLNKTGYNFDDVSKKGYLGLLKINIFWNKGYDIIIPVDDITNKIL